MKHFFYSITLLLCCSVGYISAQTDPQFSHYMYNGLFLNPGYTGLGTNTEKATEFLAIHRSQWVGDIPGVPTTQVLSVHTPVDLIKGGVGLHLTNDAIGPMKQLTVQLSYSFHLKIGNGALGIGPQVGIYNIALDGTKLNPNDPLDPAIPKGGSSNTKPDVAFGLWYRSSKIYFGVSSLHLTGSTFDFGTNPAAPGKSAQSTISKHYYITGGINFDITRDISLVPSFILKNAMISSIEASAMASFRKKFNFGVSYRHEESIIGLIGFNFLKNNALHVGYSYDYVTNDLGRFTSGSHEILLTYRIPKKVVLPPSKIIIRTPRFRLE